MHDIDFLPLEYRERYARRQSQPWQILVAIAIGGLVIAAAVMQHYHRKIVRDALAEMAPTYDAAVLGQQQLAEAKKRLKALEATAELYAYLRHPWPRTQLLHALVRQIPEGITLQQIQISRESIASRGLSTPPALTPPSDMKAEQERIEKLEPAQRDLLKLRSQSDAMQTTVAISGTATDPAALYRYIAELDATDIFEKAELDNLNAIDNDANAAGAVLQFRAVLAVEPGHGQHGGPTGDALAKRKSQPSDSDPRGMDDLPTETSGTNRKPMTPRTTSDD